MVKTRKAITGLALALTFAAACAGAAAAQGRDDRVISARAGGVNFVSGEVTFRRAGKDAWQQLATTDELRAGDAVRTGADGRAEILLNPGSYLRLGETSEFELTDPSLDTLRVKLSKGSALVEASGYGDADVRIALDTPRAPVSLVRSGVYRVNVESPGVTEIFVRKGRALVGAGSTLLKEGMSARVGAGGVAEVAKFDKDEKDSLDLWGRARAQELARAQRRLQARQVNASFARSGWDGWNATGGLFGVWYGNAGCYTFLPFYFYVSPYGYSCSMSLPAFAYLCGSCHRRALPWRSGNLNPATTAGNRTQTQAPAQFAKPPKSADFTHDNGARTGSAKVGMTSPPAGGGGSPVVRGGAPSKTTPPPR
jgi:hypothetical protein